MLAQNLLNLPVLVIITAAAFTVVPVLCSPDRQHSIEMNTQMTWCQKDLDMLSTFTAYLSGFGNNKGHFWGPLIWNSLCFKGLLWGAVRAWKEYAPHTACIMLAFYKLLLPLSIFLFTSFDQYQVLCFPNEYPEDHHSSLFQIGNLLF